MADQSELASLLQATTSGADAKKVEAVIREREIQPQFSLSLLQVVASNGFPQTTRLAGALYFKNFVKRSWIDLEGNYKIPQNEVLAIKKELVGLMTSTPPTIQAQLGDAISIIAESDFWERWDFLVDDLVLRFSQDQPAINYGVLQVAHSIFKRWRPLFRSDDLYTEINHVVEKFVGPFLKLLQSTDAAIEANASNKTLLVQYMDVMNVSIELIHDLCSQDIPEPLVESLAGVMALLEKYLVYDNPLLHTDDESDAGVLEHSKSEILELLRLFVAKYGEDVNAYIGKFAGTSWNLLNNVSSETKYDGMASQALLFLTTVTSSSSHAQTFNDDATLTQVIEKAIIPNLALREADVETFEDEPLEYTKRDLEGTDSETRRRAATDFLRQLMREFQEKVTTLTMRYIEHFIQDYTKDPSENWKSKDTAIYLFCSIAAVGAVTASQGVTTLNPFVNIIDFFSKHIAQSLMSEQGHPILQVDAIKFLYVFRSQITPAHWQEAFPLVVKHISSSNYVVRTYATIAIERTLYITNAQNEPLISKAQVNPIAKDLLQALFALVVKDTSAPEKIQENEFYMRCIMRVLITLKEDCRQHVGFTLPFLINTINLIRHNPSNPLFYYYLFEALGALIRFAAPANPDMLESSLYEPFAAVLRDDVQEFMPYVFQLFAALLEANPSAALPDYYKSLVQPILQPSFWESRGNIPALTRLLCSLVSRMGPVVVEANQLEPMLGIFQKLIASKPVDIYGFDLLEAVVAAVPAPALQQYMSTIFSLLFTRLQGSKTERFTLRFVGLYHVLAANSAYGADSVATTCDSVQANVFPQIYTGIILPESQKLSRPLDRKTAVISFTKTLAESQAFSEKYAKGWGYTVDAVLKLMVNPPAPKTEDIDIIADQDVDDAAFGVGFTQLTTVRKTVRDPFPEIGDLRVWIGNYLREFDGKRDGQIFRFVQERLSEESQKDFISYLQQ